MPDYEHNIYSIVIEITSATLVNLHPKALGTDVLSSELFTPFYIVNTLLKPFLDRYLNIRFDRRFSS